jgi:hypothetical protein
MRTSEHESDVASLGGLVRLARFESIHGRDRNLDVILNAKSLEGKVEDVADALLACLALVGLLGSDGNSNLLSFTYWVGLGR